MHEGDAIGPYRIVRRIGEGGMGAVWLAEHALLGRRVAVKSLLPSLSAQREVVERFFNEARAITAISDPGVVQVFDFGFDAHQNAYLVMELLDGEPLDARLRRLGRLPVGDALRVTRQAASSLSTAHALGIVHRDLKPENIFLVPDAEAPGGERPKLLDFGIAKLSGDPGVSKTRTGVLMGTPLYMSPEQCRGAGSVDRRSDIYSLGIVLYHMLTGAPPFLSEGAGELISAHLRETPRAPSAVCPGLPAMVDELVLRCLAKSPDDRFPRMIELQVAIDQVLVRLTGRDLWRHPSAPGLTLIEAPTTLGGAAAQSSSTRVSRRRRWPWLVVGAALLGGAAALLIATRSPSGSSSSSRAAAAASPASATPAVDAASSPTPTITSLRDVAPSRAPAVAAPPTTPPAVASAVAAPAPPPPAPPARLAPPAHPAQPRRRHASHKDHEDLYEAR